jgi:uncharacterized membrane protein
MEYKKELRKFGLIMAMVISLLFGLTIPFISNHGAYPLWPWIIASIFVIVSIIHPKLLKQVYKVWIKIGHVLGWINTRIILAVLFFGILTPIGLVLRALGKDPLLKKIEPDLTTYRIPCKTIESNEFERPF